jgi:hypothetical protein
MRTARYKREQLLLYADSFQALLKAVFLPLYLATALYSSSSLIRVDNMSSNSESQMEKSLPTEHFLWQLCKTYAQEFPDPKRPVRGELVAAFVPRVVRLLVLLHVMPGVLKRVHSEPIVFPEFWNNMAAEAANLFESYACDLISEVVELDSWLHDPDLDETGCGNWLTANGFQYQEVSQLIKRTKKYQSGRRPTNHLSTVAALDSKRLDKNRTWESLAGEFCQCDKPSHDKHCREVMRKSVAQLELILTKYRTLAIPAEVIAPLADMFLDQLGWQRSS